MIQIGLSFLLSVFAWAGPGIVGNGGGVSEQNLVYAWQNLESFLSPCQASAESCGLSRTEGRVLGAIVTDHAHERLRGGLRFAARGQTVELFQTEPRVGAVITWNTDLLFDESHGSARPFDLVRGLGLLVEALATHHAFEADQARRLGAGISRFFREGYQEFWNSEEEYRTVRLIVLSPRSSGEQAVLLSDGESFTDLTPFFKEELHCPAGGSGSAFRVSGLYWSAQEGSVRPGELQARGRIAYSCPTRFEGAFRLNMDFEPTSGGSRLRAGSVRVQLLQAGEVNQVTRLYDETGSN
ncbi:MAG: hypothetical protein NDJ89_11485 [Oligoflexia bacterium]|nr:hypothetical protein [Oligoflexia bacterium]